MIKKKRSEPWGGGTFGGRGLEVGGEPEERDYFITRFPGICFLTLFICTTLIKICKC